MHDVATQLAIELLLLEIHVRLTLHRNVVVVPVFVVRIVCVELLLIGRITIPKVVGVAVILVIFVDLVLGVVVGVIVLGCGAS